MSPIAARQKHLALAVLLGPSLVGMFIFLMLPVASSFVLSFSSWDLIGEIQWIGLDNYSKALADPAVLGALRNTLTFIRGSFKNGFPAGLAVSRDGKGLLVGTRAATTQVGRVDLSNASAPTSVFGTGLEGGNDPAGLHRALAADVYSLVDQGVGATGGVYLLKP